MMSTSISLSSSVESTAGQELEGSKRQQDVKRHYAQPAICSERSSESKELNGSEPRGVNFYQEVDERMSRNSIEYPDEQARYSFVGRWLDGTHLSRTDISPGSDLDLGNIVGIKGFFSQESSPICGKTVQERASHERLKSEHSRLQANYEKLRAQMRAVSSRFNRMLEQKDEEARALKAAMRQPAEYEPKPHCSCSQVSCEILAAENERLRSQLEQVKCKNEAEVDKLRNELQAISGEPANRLLAQLQCENSRLKETREMDSSELEALKEQYLLLESQVRALELERQEQDEVKNGEISRLMTELCRLQVYQPKLEMILKTERETKRQLQARLQTLEAELDQLRGELDRRGLDLQLERMRSRKSQATGADELQAELVRWQDKWERLKRDNGDCEELLRGAKLRLGQLDARRQADLELARETSERELAAAREANAKLDRERQQLEDELQASRSRLSQAEADQLRLLAELSDSQKRLELSLAEQSKEQTRLARLDKSERQLGALKCELVERERANGELRDELDDYRGQLDAARQQVSELQKRMQLLQAAMDEMRDKKEKELDRLRVNLNLEQYNRQVALKNVERELRSSLQELESIKSRFSVGLAAKRKPVG